MFKVKSEWQSLGYILCRRFSPLYMAVLFGAVAAVMVVSAPQAAAQNRVSDAFRSPEGRSRFGRPQATQPIYDGLFGSQERFSENISKFSKWNDVWTRTAATPPPPELSSPDALARCSPREKLACNHARWEQFLEVESRAQTSGLELLRAVNGFHNRAPYILDPVNWNLPDYWTTLTEFLKRDGDCEDYAISKFITLKRLGFDPKAMRVVVLQDENLRTAHAILAVKLDGETYILDNQTNVILPHEKILHYRPVYSINEQGWWLHSRPIK